MTDRDAWLNVAQAAQWLAEGREVERLPRKAWGDWSRQTNEPLHTDCEYRLKPEPPKPREWKIRKSWNGDRIEFDGPDFGCAWVTVREVLE